LNIPGQAYYLCPVTDERTAQAPGRRGSRSALFLDRDGTINVDRGYVHRIDQFEFLPGIFELARFWTGSLHRPIVVITNQSGIGRGYFEESAYIKLTRWMCNRFAAEGAPVARVYHCAHNPDADHGQADHPWRKPNPGMILQAASDLDLDLAESVIVGDKLSDIEAGASAGVGLRILMGARSTDSALPCAYERAADLADVLALLRRHFGGFGSAQQESGGVELGGPAGQYAAP
jgi:D-glycero-D-manno-heptose 1,7-bisphosphate phosphatase